MHKIKRTHKQKSGAKKVILIALLVLVVVIVGIFFVAADPLNIFGRSNNKTDDGINYDPPTQEDRDAVEKHKESLGNQNDNSDDQDDQQKQEKENVAPFITLAQQFNDAQYGNRVEIRSYVSEIIETGGSCTLTFTKGSDKVSWEVDGQADATTTVCTAMVPRDKFSSAGKWSVVLSYTSEKARGTSAPVEVEVE